ncbi:PAAR domain-containing protein [Pelomonas sp. P7]|uniref:PAAR domain-containing protein n=1 Tax=Pelomonas caseinilytica TaxID=2906763 RepID=A0ABS8XPN8_9BURK|nr:PAAR domain-containing protein [Pelomonas sp. P7]MCE4540658.1 PAAR domain-containing protein [Pelomonas sp. P7]
MRSSLFGKAQIIVGDKATHGGVVLSGSPTNSWHGIPVARKGDKVYCPKCKPHVFEIIEGLAICTDTNAKLPLATEGHLTACGAALVAKAAPGGAEAAAALCDAMIANQAFDEEFTLRDRDTGEPLANTPYTVFFENGNVAHGTTDAQGKTGRYYTIKPESLVIELGHAGE